VPESSGLLDVIPEPDLGYYASELERTGFGGPLNWYRTLEASWK
jgi:hypothetical protein